MNSGIKRIDGCDGWRRLSSTDQFTDRTLGLLFHYYYYYYVLENRYSLWYVLYSSLVGTVRYGTCT